MVDVVGANSFSKDLQAAPYGLQEQLELQSPYNSCKNIAKFVEPGSFSTIGDLVLWQNLINNTISTHRSNGNRACHIEEWLHIQAQYNEKSVYICDCLHIKRWAP